MQDEQRFWLSWYGHSEVSFTLSSPWWRTGWRDDQPTICAAVKAPDETTAVETIHAAHDQPVDIEWRFVKQREVDWSPFSGRFPEADWMEW